MTHGLFVSTKRMTGFTHAHLSLVSDYLWVLSSQQDSLMSIYHSSVITRKYKSARQELLVSHSQAVYFSCCMSSTQSYFQIFSRHEVLLTSFVNLDMSCTVNCNSLENICGWTVVLHIAKAYCTGYFTGTTRCIMDQGYGDFGTIISILHWGVLIIKVSWFSVQFSDIKLGHLIIRL